MSSRTKKELLPVLYQRIEARCHEIAQAAKPWPCQSGCDHCCRHLSEAPRLVDAEWRQIEAGLKRLAPDDLFEVEKRLLAVASQTSGSVVCPFLASERGACLIYAHRPAACRTYGFYQGRGGGLHCHIVEEHVAQIEVSSSSPWDSPIVWGFQEAVDSDLGASFGPEIGLREWFERRRASRGEVSAVARKSADTESEHGS